MSTSRQKSAIREVRDQLLLSYADGSNLDNLSLNFGIRRVPFGYTDDEWRAILREVAFRPKQIITRFHGLLELLFGPKETRFDSLAAAVTVGSRTVFVNDPYRFPQVGTLVLDEGLANEETVEYGFIEYDTGEIFLRTATAQSHAACVFDEQFSILPLIVGATEIYVPRSIDLPTSGFPVSLIVGRGTPSEEVVQLLGNDTDAGVLTVSATVNAHEGAAPTVIQTRLFAPYVVDSPFLVCEDLHQFTAEGLILTGPTDSVFTASAGTTTSVTVASPTFSEDRLVRYRVVFAGNVTAALAGVEAHIVANNSTVLTLQTTLGAAPAAGDTFQIRIVEPYDRLSYDDNIIQLRRDLPAELTLPVWTSVEQLLSPALVGVASAQVKAADWDIYQTDPRLLEIYLPDEIRDLVDLRSASFLHTAYIDPTPATAMSAGSLIGDTTLTVTSTADFPLVGVVVVDDGGGNEEYLAYSVVDATTLALPTPATVAHLIAETVELHQPRYGVTDLLEGNVWTEDHTFPGPYLFNPGERAANPEATAYGQLATTVSGPTRVAQGTVTGNTAVEVADASAFPSAGFPYEVLAGRNSGNREVLTVNGVALKQRTRTTLSGGPYIAGATSFDVTALAGPTTSSTFLDARGYRILLDRGGANAEVLWVTGVTPGAPDTVQCEPSLLPHVAGETVELLADVFAADPLTDVHDGLVSFADRKALYPAYRHRFAETVEYRFESLPLISTVGFSTDGGQVILNHAQQRMNASSRLAVAAPINSTFIDLADTSAFPTTYPYTVRLSRDGYREEYVTVTNNNTGLNRLTLQRNTRFAHDPGRLVTFTAGTPETLTYATVSGNNLTFDTPVVVKSTQWVGTSVIPSLIESLPDTDGYDFALHMPPDVFFRIRDLLDLIRAAGIEVTLISTR